MEKKKVINGLEIDILRNSSHGEEILHKKYVGVLRGGF